MGVSQSKGRPGSPNHWFLFNENIKFGNGGNREMQTYIWECLEV